MGRKQRVYVIKYKEMNRKDVNQLNENSCLKGRARNKNSMVSLTVKNKKILYSVLQPAFLTYLLVFLL